MISRDFVAGAGVTDRSLTAVVTLLISMDAADAAQLWSIDPRFRPPAVDAEAELLDAAAPSPDVVVEASSSTPRVSMHGMPFPNLLPANLPPSWLQDAIAQGRCLLMFGTGALQRRIWATVR